MISLVKLEQTGVLLLLLLFIIKLGLDIYVLILHYI